MRAPISVVIPTLDAGATLPACLGALFEGVEAGLIRELVISDGGSGDDTKAIADAAGALFVTGAPSRGGQLRRGVAASAGDWVMVVHADSVLAPGWSDAVAAHLGASERAGWFRLRFAATGVAARIVAGWANLRARLFGLPFGDQGLLLPRELYDAVGGYPDMPIMEDVAMARALRGRLAGLGGTITTGAEKYQRDGWARRGARNIMLQLRFLIGADPEKLLKRY